MPIQVLQGPVWGFREPLRGLQGLVQGLKGSLFPRPHRVSLSEAYKSLSSEAIKGLLAAPEGLSEASESLSILRTLQDFDHRWQLFLEDPSSPLNCPRQTLSFTRLSPKLTRKQLRFCVDNCCIMKFVDS